MSVAVLAFPPVCCGLLETVATICTDGAVLTATGDWISFCPFCGATLIAGPPRDEPALPVPTPAMIERGRSAFANLVAWNRDIMTLLHALDRRRG